MRANRAPESRPTPSRRLLWALSLLVLAGHLLLAGLPQRAPAPKAAAAPVFSTRSIRLPAPQAAAPPAAPANPTPPPARPQPRPKPRPKPHPVPTPAPTSDSVQLADALPPASTSEDMASNASPDAEAAAAGTDSTAAVPPQITDTSTAEPPAPIPPPSAAGPVALPGSARLLYDVQGQVKKLNYQARAELLWRHDASQYDLRFEVSAFLIGSRVQTSQGQLGPQGLSPKRFSDKSRSERAAHFNYEQGRVTFSANSADVPLSAGMQDRLSVFIQLGALLAAQPEAFPPGTTISQATVGPRHADQWQVTVAGPETLRLQGQEVPTLRLTRPPGQQYDQQVELWYAPHLGYLPVRIRLTQPNGDFADMQLRSHENP